MRFSVIFSLAALLLTGVGLYGVVAFSVNRQQQEIGISCALGANTSHVLRQVLAALLSRVVNLSDTLYGLSSLDPLALGATLVILLTVSLLASGSSGPGTDVAIRVTPGATPCGCQMSGEKGALWPRESLFPLTNQSSSH